MGKTFRPENSDELRRDLMSSSPNDTIIMKAGKRSAPNIFYLDRIHSFDNLKVYGGDDDATKTIIRPKEGRAFRCQGGSTFQNFMSQGGGNVIEAEGHGTTIKNYIGYRANIPVKLSGDNHLFDGGLIYEAERTGIEVNGGFYMIPELSDRPFRLKKEVGLLNGQEPSQEWSQSQKDKFHDLFYHRNMNTTIKNVVGVRCGYAGGTMYGGFIKCVPNAGGVTLAQNVGIENLIDYWNDFPSEERFYVYENVSIRAFKHAVFCEGYVGDTARADIFDNLIIGSERGLFYSAFPEARSWGNKVFFKTIGKVIHGLTGNRDGKNTGSVTNFGEAPDTLISMGSEYYKAHQVAAVEANYDFESDHLYNLSPLDDGPYKVEAPDNAHKPETKISVPLYQGQLPTNEEILEMIPEAYRLPDVISVLNQVSYSVDIGDGGSGEEPDNNNDGNTPPDNTEALEKINKFKTALDDLVSDINQAKDSFNSSI